MKNLMRVTETNKVQERIEALEYAIEIGRGRRDKAACLGNMLAEYTSRLTYLEGAKEYMVHFVGGGWNTCYGVDEECALHNAKMEHDKEALYGYAALKVKSVSLASTEGKEAAMRLFY